MKPKEKDNDNYAKSRVKNLDSKIKKSLGIKMVETDMRADVKGAEAKGKGKRKLEESDFPSLKSNNN